MHGLLAAERPPASVNPELEKLEAEKAALVAREAYLQDAIKREDEENEE